MENAVAQPPQATGHSVSGKIPDQQCNQPHRGDKRNKHHAAFPFVIPDNFLVAFVGRVLEYGHPVEPRMYRLLCAACAGFADGVEVLFAFFLARFVVTELHIVCVACGGIEQGNGGFLQFTELRGSIGAAVYIGVHQFGFAAVGAADVFFGCIRRTIQFDITVKSNGHGVKLLEIPGNGYCRPYTICVSKMHVLYLRTQTQLSNAY